METPSLYELWLHTILHKSFFFYAQIKKKNYYEQRKDSHCDYMSMHETTYLDNKNVLTLNIHTYYPPTAMKIHENHLNYSYAII